MEEPLRFEEAVRVEPRGSGFALKSQAVHDLPMPIQHLRQGDTHRKVNLALAILRNFADASGNEVSLVNGNATEVILGEDYAAGGKGRQKRSAPRHDLVGRVQQAEAFLTVVDEDILEETPFARHGLPVDAKRAKTQARHFLEERLVELRQQVRCDLVRLTFEAVLKIDTALGRQNLPTTEPES